MVKGLPEGSVTRSPAECCQTNITTSPYTTSHPTQLSMHSKEFLTQLSMHSKENPNAAKHPQQGEPPRFPSTTTQALSPQVPPVSTRCSSKQQRNQWHGTPTHPPQSKYPPSPSTPAFTRPCGKQPQRQGHSTLLCSQSAVANNNMACFTTHLHHH